MRYSLDTYGNIWQQVPSCGLSVANSDEHNRVNIHLSHYVATQTMELSRVRTSYERMVAHRARLPFAYPAEEDGTIVELDQDAKVLKIEYKSGKVVAVSFGDEYTKNGGGGFYCTQNVVVNNFKQGDKVKKGDIVVYNERFFTPDPYSRQVDWNMGVIANVACIEANTTLDDGNAISASLAKKLAFNPVHVRDVVIKRTTTIHEYADVGTSVLNTDPLMVFDQSEMSDDMFGKLDDAAVAMLAKLNRQTPKAKFSGRICKIDAFFRCEEDSLSPSIAEIVRKIKRIKASKAKAAKGATNESQFDKTMQIKYTDRIGITDVDEDTVILRFYIQQDMGMDIGSKIEFCTSSKSVTSHIEPEDWDVDDHSTKVQAMYSAIGINNRIICSPIIIGTTSRVMEELERRILAQYFNNKP